MITYSSLREIQKKEMESAAIVHVEENFYEQLAQLLEKKKQEAQQNNSLLVIREYENIRKIVQSIQGKREEKIALIALRGEKVGTGLSSEERQLLISLGMAISDARATVKQVWERETPAPVKKVRIVKDVEQYKGLDSHVYGPFRIGEEPALPREEVDWLLKAKMAEIVLA